jgi:hypothetical protein
MVSAADVLTNHGLGLAEEIVAAAHLEHLDLAVAATIIQKESGGRNVWGSDPGLTGGTYSKGAAVTQANYLAYRAAVQTGRIGRQGVGPAQCTSAGYQNSADQLGGCWLPVPNMRSGFRGIGALINKYGVRGGFVHYNGSGPAAQAYANDAMTKYAIWQQRLAGAQEDDLTPDQDAMLTAVYQFITGSATVVPQGTNWPGWPTWPGGTDEDLTATDYSRRANVQLKAIAVAVDALRPKSVGDSSIGRQLSAADVNRIAAAVVALQSVSKKG